MMPPADGFLSKGELCLKEKSYPLEVCICKDCSLVQLGYTVSPQILYQMNYPYESSITKTGVTHFYSFASQIVSDFGLSRNDLAVDIGSNVGVLLEGFKKSGIKVLGVEPAANICQKSHQRGIEAINDFFNAKTVKLIIREKGKAKVITGTNVIAHIDNLHSLVRNVKNLLTEKGIFVFEAPYLADLINNLEYDTIYHEHLMYFSVKPLITLFDQFDMEIFDIKKQRIHGGSLRYFISRKYNYPVSAEVNKFLKIEKEQRIHDIATFRKFSKRVKNNRKILVTLLESLKSKGKRIAGVGAPAKGMTLLNYCGIGPETLDFVTEKSKLKINKFTPGRHIPIVPDSRLIKAMPDYALLLPWNFANEIMNNLKNYTKLGGKFILPIPSPRIIS